jgi:uncharacterized protein (TIGR04255 family)
MSDYETFKNPPITEAIIDIRVELGTDFEYALLKDICNEIHESYPEVIEQKKVQSTIQIAPTGRSESPNKVEHQGFFCYSHDKKKIIQNRIDGFTFNKLKPYENWEKLKDESMSMWQIYSKIAKPVKITRIALRYINNIGLPLPIKDFKDYFKTTPDIAPTLPQSLSQFFMQLVVPDDETGAEVMINQTMKSSVENNKLSYLFDIDAQKNLNITQEYFETIWDEFERLRKLKNKIFIESLTEKAKELFR